MNDLPRRPHEKGDAWVFGGNGERYWGTYGAAGLLVWHRRLGVLLQHRAVWSHHGGTWGIPGGARKEDESARDAAFREAQEEAGVPPESLHVIATRILDRGVWTYTTVVVEALEEFVPVIGDAESEALAWVPVAEVDALPLHPGFAASWPELRALLG